MSNKTDRKNVPLESSSSMILFPSLASGTDKAQSVPPRVIRGATKIHRFTSMRTPSPNRDTEHHLPSTVRMRSSPTLPSPLGESPSQRHFEQFRNEIKSPSATSTSFSSGISGVSKATGEETEGEAEEDTSIEISIYRPRKKRIRATDLREDGDEEDGREICSDEEYQPIDTDSDTTEDDNLSFIVDMDNSDNEETSYEEGTESESCAELSTSDYNPGPVCAPLSPYNTETEEDNSEQDIYSFC